MPKSAPTLRPAEPGTLVYYSLDLLTRPARKYNVPFDTWGVCEHDNFFWIGRQISIEGKDVLRLSLLDVLDKRDEAYAEWGDEEINLFFGLDSESGEFKWFLLNEEEFQAAVNQPEDLS